jgi:hypothetical protein
MQQAQHAQPYLKLFDGITRFGLWCAKYRMCRRSSFRWTVLGPLFHDKKRDAAM